LLPPAGIARRHNKSADFVFDFAELAFFPSQTGGWAVPRIKKGV
jgi:hypothetical protein